MRLAFAIAFLPLLCGAAQADSRGTVLSVSQHFFAPASDASGAPRGISGIVCAAAKPDGLRECLVANDEEAFLERVLLSPATFTPTGRVISLAPKDDSGIVGTARVAACPVRSDDSFGKPDTEGLALADGYVYAVGSHSCSGGGKYRPSSFLLSRFRMAGAGTLDAAGTVERSWRLADMLVASDVGAAYGKKKDDGTNVEGVAVADGLVYAGLRTPLLDNHVVIVTAPVAQLFAPGIAPLDPSVVRTYRMPLGPGSGIRDLAALEGGRLLILSGPTHIQTDVPYRLWLADRARLNDPPLFLANVTPQEDDAGQSPKGRGYGGDRPKAEAIAVLEQGADTISVLVMYDNVDEGWPTRMTIRLPK